LVGLSGGKRLVQRGEGAPPISKRERGAVKGKKEVKEWKTLRCA